MKVNNAVKCWEVKPGLGFCSFLRYILSIYLAVEMLEHKHDLKKPQHCLLSLPSVACKHSFFSPFSHALIIFCLFLTIATFTGLRQCILVILIFTSLIISDFEHFYLNLLAMCILKKQCIFIFFPFRKSDFLFAIELFEFLKDISCILSLYLT